MSKKEQIRYNMDTIDKEGANINLIYGERSNGKSYQVKHKKGILKYQNGGTRYIDPYYDKGNIIKSSIEKGSKFMLIKRRAEDMKSSFIEQYFQDVDIDKITNGLYNCVDFFSTKIYLAKYNIETGKVKRGPAIAYGIPLSLEQRFAGASYLDVTDMIFEEFMARDGYLYDEPDKLMNLYSTVDRKRGTTRLWLVGNSISKICPYLNDWGLSDIVKHQKQGTIETKWIPTGDIDENNVPIEVKIAIEYCADTGKSSYIIGKHKNMLNKGEWQSDPQPKLPKSYKKYKMLYRMMFIYQGFKFICELLCDKESKHLVWFIYPTNKDPSEKMLVFSDIIKTSPYWQKDIYQPTLKNEKLKQLLQTFKENRIFYASDLCGTDFKQVIDFTIRK